MAQGFALPYTRFRAFKNDGTNDPLAGGKLHTYIPGTTTPKATYQDVTLLTPHANPVILDSNGEALIYGNGSYDLDLDDSADVDVWTAANITFLTTSTAGSTVTEQWTDPGHTPTFIDTVSFSVTGDQTATYTSGRRIRATLSGSTIYGTISYSAFSTVTTVVVAWDGGSVLDATVSAVAVGVMTPDDTGVPFLREYEWSPQQGPFTFVSGTVFTVTGDQTTTYSKHMLIRAKLSPGSYIYGKITSAVFTSLTTITVAWESGSLSTDPQEIALWVVDINRFLNTSPQFQSKVTVQTTTTPFTFYELDNTGQTMKGRLTMDSAGIVRFTGNVQADGTIDDNTKDGFVAELGPGTTGAFKVKKFPSGGGGSSDLASLDNNGNLTLLGGLTLGTALPIGQLSLTLNKYTAAGPTSCTNGSFTTIMSQSLGTVNTGDVLICTFKYSIDNVASNFVEEETSGGIWDEDFLHEFYSDGGGATNRTHSFILRAISSGSKTFTFRVRPSTTTFNASNMKLQVIHIKA